ncbi:MAG: hypothetical protein ACHQ17_00460 [Polyangia bacterium]|jgi:hypothetical protein
MKKIALAFGLVVLASGLACNEGHEELAPPDLAAQSDLAPARDLSMPDLLGPSCGKIILCILQCGVTNVQCDQTCVAGAQPAAIEQAGALALCAAQNCLQSDGGLSLGGGNPSDLLGIISCLQQSCPNEVNSCSDLPFVGTM